MPEEITLTLTRDDAKTLLALLAAETDYPADRWADGEIDRLDTCYGRLRDALGLDPAAALDLADDAPATTPAPDEA